ncbi:beta-mannosidase-like [Liolophura sinensis]|uniref:beta-mannosidase-like n=1 Tax=Liolophura sinensis TaxID=3198878 RepID=UPI003158B80D
MESRRYFQRVITALILQVTVSICDTYVTSAMIDLTGLWTVMNSGSNGTLFTVQGKVPGNMYTALLSNKRIVDPYYMYNDDHYRWIPRENWTYQKTFQVSSDIYTKSRVILSCDGLDTIATIKVNGQVVGKSSNMFVKYDFDIKSALKLGVNEIRVEFQSAIEYAAQKASAMPHVIPPKCSNPAQHGECHVNMIRKEQCSFSWDWGPSFPTQGIWKNISIVAFDTAVVEALTAETWQGSGADSWVLTVEVFFQAHSPSPVSGVLQLTMQGTSLHNSVPLTLTTGKSQVSLNYTLSNVSAWWPNGYGSQPLYNLKAVFTSGSEVSSKAVRVGFRTVELVQDPIPNATGLTFYFKVNGVPIFMKGSNWIPADSFQDRVTVDRYRDLLGSARLTHMNCLRVWGGGIYENDEFYDIADELGIMIWQDFMFAVALYPADADFLTLVKGEITHQVRRLKSHPSILLWAGNNENEKALAQNWFGTQSEFDLYKKEYIDLYINTIAPIVQREDPSRPYVSSSPSNGKETEKEGWIAKDPGDWHYGDEHFYDYLSDLWDVSKFPILRFASEYGIQSWPSLETLSKVSEPSQWDYWSDWCAHRQHHPMGNVEMMSEIIRHFSLTFNPDKKQRFEDTIYLTQINQAMSIRWETEHYRRWQSQLVDSYGLTMGALYWQLNDIWQAPTWASIEYGGKWKMLHYYAKRFFAPNLISPYLDGNIFKVYMVVDKLPADLGERSGPVQTKTTFSHRKIGDKLGYQVHHSVLHMDQPVSSPQGEDTLYIRMMSWGSLTPLYTWKQSFTLNSTSDLVFEADLADMLTTSKCPAGTGCVLFLYVNDLETGPDTWFPLSSFSEASLKAANIQITSLTPTSQSSSTFNLTLSTDNMAAFVWLEATGIPGTFLDNGFLFATPTVNITFTAKENVDPAALKEAIKIKSLVDIYKY